MGTVLSACFATNVTNGNAAATADFSMLAAAPATNSGEGIYVAAAMGNTLLVMPFGTDADGEHFDIQVFRFYPTTANAETARWMGVSAGEVRCTLGTATGVSGQIPAATDLLCDTAVVTGGAGIAVDSPTDNTSCAIRIQTLGASYIMLLFDRTDGGTDAASANALVGFID